MDNNTFYKYLFLGSALWVLNEIVAYSKLGIVIAIICGIVVSLLLLAGKYAKAFLVHILFTLTSLEFSRDLLTLKEIYTYRTVQIFNISISTIMLFVIFIFVILKYGKKLVDIIKVPYIRNVLIIFNTALIIGIIGIVFNENPISYFIKDVQYYLVFVVTIIIVYIFRYLKILQFDLLSNIIASTIVARSFVVFVANIAGFRYGNYGGVNIFSYDSIDLLGLALIIEYFLLKPGLPKAMAGIGFILSTVNVTIFQASGKGIIFAPFIIIFVGLILVIKYPERLFSNIHILLAILVMLFAIAPRYFTGDYVKLTDIKLYEAKALLNMDFIKNPYLLPDSPRDRVLELFNIVGTYVKEPLYTFTGRGFGGYFIESKYYNYTANTGGYSITELLTRKFSSPHESLNNVILKFGLMGTFLWLYVLIKALFKLLFTKKNEFFNLLFVILWGFFIGFSMKLVLLMGILYVIFAFEEGIVKDNSVIHGLKFM